MCLDVSGCEVLSGAECHHNHHMCLQNALQMQSLPCCPGAHQILPTDCRAAAGPSGATICPLHTLPSRGLEHTSEAAQRAEPASPGQLVECWIWSLLGAHDRHDGIIPNARGKGLKLKVEQQKLQMVHTSGTAHFTRTEGVAKATHSRIMIGNI